MIGLNQAMILLFAQDDNVAFRIAGCSALRAFDTVASRLEMPRCRGKWRVHGDSEMVAGHFGLSDLQDAGEVHGGPFGVEVRDVPEGLSSAR
jgi:hypothetical protein